MEPAPAGSTAGFRSAGDARPLPAAPDDRAGRVKHHCLNPLPLQEVIDRRINPRPGIGRRA